LKDIIGVLQADLETLKTEKLRLMADMDNLRKRAEKERADTAKYAVTKFAQDVVGVVDNFERAAAAVPAEAAEKDAALKSFLGGVLLAEREFLAVLERHGVKRIEAQGQPFNPHHHQAVLEREDVSVPSGTVLQVFQAGFMIEERCLRPAMVVVSTGGGKAGKASEPAPAAPAETKPANDSGGSA
jgi:molecular chaperone GrpE